jgi:hypothetical protein
MKPHRWLRWAWKVAFATYVAGALTLATGSSLIVFWTVLLFTPLITWTLVATRSRRLAAMTLPVLGSAVLAAAYLGYGLQTRRGVPSSTIFQVTWLIGVFGPLVLYWFVSRELSRDPGHEAVNRLES